MRVVCSEVVVLRPKTHDSALRASQRPSGMFWAVGKQSNHSSGKPDIRSNGQVSK